MTESKFAIGFFILLDVISLLFTFSDGISGVISNYLPLIGIGIFSEIAIVSTIYEHEKYIKEKNEKERYKILYEARKKPVDD